MRFKQLLILTLAAGFCFGGCRDDNDDENKNNPPKVDGQQPTTDGGNGGGEGSTIYDIMKGTIPQDTQVLLADVIVTAVDLQGEYTGDVYVQEVAGGKYSGIRAFRPQRIDGEEIKDLKVGDHVRVEGTVKYFVPTGGFNDDYHPDKLHIVQLGQGAQITRISDGEVPAPEVLSISELINDPTAAEWEHVLVTVKDVAVSERLHPEYGEFGVIDSAGKRYDVDDELYQHNPSLEDCLSVTGISSYFFGYKLNLRSAADVAAGSGCPAPLALTISDLQDPQSANHPALSSWVKVSGVVSAVDGYPTGTTPRYNGFWIQDAAGGPYSGIYIYYSWKDGTDASKKPVLQEKVLLYGFYDEYKPASSQDAQTSSQLKYADWLNQGQAAAAVQPALVDPAQVATGGSLAAQYEGVLIRVEDVEVGELVKDSKGKNVAMKLSGSELVIDRELHNFLEPVPPAVGTSYSAISGPLHFSYGNFKLLPRSAADLQR